MTEASRVEALITTAFSNIRDDFGNPIRIELSMTLLVQLLSGQPSESILKEYELLGESAVQFAINIVLLKKYSSFSNEILRTLAKHFRNLSQLYKVVSKQTAINKFVKSPNMIIIMNSVMGVLYRHYGISVVERFIRDSVIFLTESHLSGASPKKKSHSDASVNPVQGLHIMIQDKNGKMEATSNVNADLTWNTTLVVKLASDAPIFSHSRTSGSKSKAKTEACQDILTYLSNHPDELERLKQPSEGDTSVHVLPISEAEYCHLYPNTPGNMNTKSRIAAAANTSDWEASADTGLHIPQHDDEEAMQQLSSLLLLNSMDIDPEPRQKKRHRSGVFSPAEGDMTTSSSSSSEYMLPNDVVIKSEPEQMTVASLMETTHNAMEMEPSVKYIKDEEVFQPFNRPTNAAPESMDYQEKVIRFFRKTFAPHRSVLLQAISLPGQSKSIFLSFVVQHKDEVRVDIKTQQGGSSHEPIFNAEVTLVSVKKPGVQLVTEGMHRRKKDAEQSAFFKLVEYMVKQD